MKRALLLALLASPAGAHRLDEYLQGTLITVESGRVSGETTLTPGVAVFPALIGEIDRNGDGVVSAAEQQTYAARVVGELSLRIDDWPLRPRARVLAFPTVEEMKAGRGEIRLEWSADLPPGGSNRRLIFENRHESRIAAYQVNCLVPKDPRIRVVAQKRNYTQSHYELDFEEARVSGAGLGWPLALVAGLLTARIVWIRLS